MTPQFGKEVDKKLNKLAVNIRVSENIITSETGRKDGAWEEVFAMFDEFNKDEARFIAEDGYVLARGKRQNSPKIDGEKLHHLLQEKYPKTAEKLWSRITTQVIDARLLEVVMQGGEIDASIVEECITTPEPTYIRLHPVWTKEDHERAVIFGVKKSEKEIEFTPTK